MDIFHPEPRFLRTVYSQILRITTIAVFEVAAILLYTACWYHHLITFAIGLAVGYMGLFMVERYWDTLALRKAVCKGLAGLELGLWHEADELVLGTGMNRHLAQAIIDGDYDELLNDPLTCRYIG